MIDIPAVGATNWPPPSYDPQTEFFYLNGNEAYGSACPYDTSDDPKVTATAIVMFQPDAKRSGDGRDDEYCYLEA
jgi:hypothetical protein